MPPSPVSSVSFVIRPPLPGDSQEAGNRSSRNKREEGAEGGRRREGRDAAGAPAVEAGLSRGFYPAEPKPSRRLEWRFLIFRHLELRRECRHDAVVYAEETQREMQELFFCYIGLDCERVCAAK